MEITKKMEIYFEDLNQDAQQEYIEVIGAKTLDEINMITPIAIIEIENNIIDNNLSNSDTHHKTDCQILEADNNKANITGKPQFIDPADPANIGQFYEGGYIAGVIDSTQTEGASGERYALIVAPKASGEKYAIWGGYNYTVKGAKSTWNGKQNTIDLMADSQSHPAASFCNDLTIDGYSDWYLPAPDELELIYRNFKPIAVDNYTDTPNLHDQINGYNPNSDPIEDGYIVNDPSQTKLSNWQECGDEALDKSTYWSSMESNNTTAWYQYFYNGYHLISNKCHMFNVRAVRKVLLSPSPKTYISELDKYVGNSHEGGYLAGVIDSTQTEGASGKRYALIVAPKASGEHNSLEWGGYNSTISGADSTWNGKQNTIDLMTDSQSHPAASFCNDLTIGGYSDWYLPAPDELELIYCSFKPTTLGNHTGTRDLYGQTNGYNPNSDPAKDGYTTSNPSQTRLSDWQDGGSEFLDDTYYWSSMKDCKTHAWNQAFSHALQISSYKDGSCKVRAVRQVIL